MKQYIKNYIGTILLFIFIPFGSIFREFIILFNLYNDMTKSITLLILIFQIILIVGVIFSLEDLHDELFKTFKKYVINDKQKNKE